MINICGFVQVLPKTCNLSHPVDCVMLILTSKTVSIFWQKIPFLKARAKCHTHLIWCGAPLFLPDTIIISFWKTVSNFFNGPLIITITGIDSGVQHTLPGFSHKGRTTNFLNLEGCKYVLPLILGYGKYCCDGFVWHHGALLLKTPRISCHTSSCLLWYLSKPWSP
jgi:hypothetical protein